MKFSFLSHQNKIGIYNICIFLFESRMGRQNNKNNLKIFRVKTEITSLFVTDVAQRTNRKEYLITARVKIARIKSATSIAQNRKKSTIVYWTSTSSYTNKLYIFISNADARNKNTRIRVSEIPMVNNCNNSINNNNNYNLPYLNASVSVGKAITAAYGKIVLKPLVDSDIISL